ncbi:MAG: tRNA (adenosine(37)-N6)-threonylcarbamoyltransferase complex ATPase subunit type 1 TsaE [Paludibacteraceae bacterium]|nr:tRNA (adenosine(37)-N6)-threonylcarbamoyltransferase complex ATPase subunit type 1 TsaE [Paludibacteraceae bacterium]
MDNGRIDIASIDDLKTAARKLLDLAGTRRVFAFDAPMGAGKTTFIKALCECLGVTEYVTSPTFAIINEYQSGTRPVFHFDLYRLRNLNEALDIGIEDYLDSGEYCFIEWPDVVNDLLPEDTLIVQIKVNEDNSRTVILQ